MNGHASAGLVVNRRDKATAVCTCGKEFTRTGMTPSGFPPSFTAHAALDRHLRTEADKAAKLAPAPRITLVVEMDSAAWADATEEERTRWVAEIEDAVHVHGRVVGVVR